MALPSWWTTEARRGELVWLALAAALGAVASAFAWHGVSEQEALRSGRPFLYWLGLIGVVGLLLGVVRAKRFLETTLAITVGAVLHYYTGVIAVHGQQDPTSHNLWPIELALMFGLGCVTALIGTGVGAGLGLGARELTRR